MTILNKICFFNRGVHTFVEAANSMFVLQIFPSILPFREVQAFAILSVRILFVCSRKKYTPSWCVSMHSYFLYALLIEKNSRFSISKKFYLPRAHALLIFIYFVYIQLNIFLIKTGDTAILRKIEFYTFWCFGGEMIHLK